MKSKKKSSNISYLICGWIATIVGGVFTLMGLISFVVGGFVLLIFSIPLLLVGLKYIKIYKNNKKMKMLDIENEKKSLEEQEKIEDVNVLTLPITYNDTALNDTFKKFVSIDLETTGLNYYNDKIIEIGAVIFENGEVSKTFNTLINPKIHIPKEASNINHITDEMVKEAPDEKEALNKLIDFLDEEVLNGNMFICGHNAKFDISFLEQALIRNKINATISYIDTLKESRTNIKGLINYKLNTVATYFNIVNEEEHRAKTDAEVSGKILIEIAKKIRDKRNREAQLNKKQTEFKPIEEEAIDYLTDMIIEQNLDTEYLEFKKLSGNYLAMYYFYKVVTLKFGKINYAIISKKYAEKNNLKFENCVRAENSRDNVRYCFEKIEDLQNISKYIISEYKITIKSAKGYMKEHDLI